MSETTACPECGKPISVEVTWCPFCERHIARDHEDDSNAVAATRALLKAEKEVPDVLHCRRCQRELSAYVDKCPYCGQHTHHESHFEDRRRGLLRSRGLRFLFYIASAIALLVLVGSVLFNTGPDGPEPPPRPEEPPIQ
jgi:predicted amidophosphoribosyltransferase